MKNPPPLTLLFDLDGTLVDSAPDIAAALNRLMAARDLAPFTVAETASFVGDGVGGLVARALTARGQPVSTEAAVAFAADYGTNYAVHSRLFPDVEPTLTVLRERGWRMAVCTNKPEAPARALLETLGIGGFFAAIRGGDSLTRKPDPAHLLAALSAAGGTVSGALMTGDHANDVAGAHAAGIACVFAGWGYGTAAMAQKADALAARFADLPRIAAGLLDDAALKMH